MVKVADMPFWAVASALPAEEAASWMQSAAPAAAWTFRMPVGGELQAAQCLRALQQQAPWLAVHGQSDLAFAAKADAVIAGARSLPWDELAGQAQNEGLRFGASVHDADELERAQGLGADFVVVGPVFATPSKQGILEPLGLEGLRPFLQAQVRVVAIGGIESPEQVATLAEEGVHAVAALRAARDPGRFAELCAAWPTSAGGSRG